MVNEEDHIRIQAMGNDLSLQTLYEKASALDDTLDSELDVSFDETLGYLTTCPTNIGTGMRASVMLHLPGLTIMKRMNRIAQTINRFGFTIRGIYGEGSQVYGHIYQISNQLTLGKTEEEIIESLTEVVQQIINEEMQIRERLSKHNKIETLDRVYRSLGILKYSRLISMEEASFRLSEVKLGIDLDYIDLKDFKFNELMVAIQSPFLLDDEDDRTVNEKRADILREHILLGLMKEPEGIAAKVLESFDITEEKVVTEVEKLIGHGQEQMGALHYTPRAKKVIELSMDEARKLHHNFVGTEHILLGLIR